MKKDDLVSVRWLPTSVEAEMFKTLLESEGVTAIIKQSGPSAIASVYGGGSNLGAEIFVSPEDAERADEILPPEDAEAEIIWPEGMEPDNGEE